MAREYRLEIRVSERERDLIRRAAQADPAMEGNVSLYIRYMALAGAEGVVATPFRTYVKDGAIHTFFVDNPSVELAD